jgi:predicted RNase H-like nuclease
VTAVAGVDGCRAGWVVVTGPAEGGGPVSLEVVGHFSTVLERVEAGALGAVAVDIPIGLPAAGPRRCDIDARRLLTRRRSSVFPAPARSLLGARSWAETRGISRQTYGILAKVAEVDALLSFAGQDRVVEAHPEVSFTHLAGRPPAHPKRTLEGRQERLVALARVFPGVPLARLPGAAPDDVLDALVLCWTAGRFLHGEAVVLGDGQCDARGLRMEIVA